VFPLPSRLPSGWFRELLALAVQQRIQVLYSGHVQGVGFRYSTRSIASRLPVTGWVRNLSDGRVELVAEGSKDILNTLMTEISEVLGVHIRQAAVDWRPATGEFTEFHIRH
jgi:acylphosphatase